MFGNTWLIWSGGEYSDHTVCRGVLGSYGVYGSIPIIRYAGEYLAHIQCRGVFQSYGMQGSTCKISTIGSTWLIWSAGGVHVS